MPYTKDDIHQIVLNQRQYFNTGETLDIKFRIRQLKKLKQMMLDNSESIVEALKVDLGRDEVESFLCDIGPVIMEIDEYIKGVRKWSKSEKHFSGFACFPSLHTYVHKLPYGVTLIVSPFNFPFMLSVGVLAASISAGNTAIIKASSKSKESTRVLKEIVAKTFDEKYITVIDGGHDVADFCLEEKVDKIFYTGSPRVAKHVMEVASRNLTPVALELGGETGNWCVIRKDADIEDAARKIAFFKLLNAGQVCININQVAVSKEIAEKFVFALKNAFILQIGENSLTNNEYPKLISEAAYLNIEKEANEYKDRIVFGGVGDKEKCKHSPTIIYPVKVDEAIVNHEIFGPLLPIVEFEDDKVDELLDLINSREHGLAFYLFTKDKKWAKKVMKRMQYGGGCINEVCVHLMVKGVPFNGVGHSGMGAYHGKWGFNEFSHPSTVLVGSTHFNLNLREHPYSKKKKDIMSKFMR